MKNQFSLYIYVSDIRHLLNLEETMRIIPKPSQEFLEIMDHSTMSNQLTLNDLKNYMYKYFGLHYEGNIEGIYFGQETCENLVPSLKHVQEALEYCRTNEYTFILATPYVSIKGIERLKKLFEYLNTEAPDTEVLVNDYGVLHLLNTSYTNLNPLLGRLLIKMKRDPRFSISGYDIANIGIKNVKRVEENQQDVLQNSSLEIPSYQEFLRSKGIRRLSVDALPQGMDAKSIKKWGFPVDLYWPWTYITSNRSCTTAAYTQPGKETHPTDEPCRFQCREYEFNFRSDKQMLTSVLRGNTVWMNTRALQNDYFAMGFDRLIYEPYIPV
jgi:hypothetical protein